MSTPAKPLIEQAHFLTVAEAAELLRVKPRTIHYWVAEGRIPFRKAGRFTLFDRAELIEWTRSDGEKNPVTLIPLSR